MNILFEAPGVYMYAGAGRGWVKDLCLWRRGWGLLCHQFLKTGLAPGSALLG